MTRTYRHRVRADGAARNRNGRPRAVVDVGVRRSTIQSSVTVLVSIGVAAGVAWATSDGGVRVAGVPVVMWCAGLAFAVNWVAFVPSWLLRTEKFYDLTGTLTYLIVVTAALVAVGRYDTRSVLLTAMVACWTVRLGSFLFRRVLADGGDGRFDLIKHDPAQLFMTWTLQGLWVFLTLAAALGAVTAASAQRLGVLALVGLAVWVVGFVVEVVADRQKRAFRAGQVGGGREGALPFITTGLWAWSRHPNYFGEITLWCGAALVAAGGLGGWRWVAMVSPVFVWALITRVSGVPLLERRAEERWGTDPGYREYVARTPVLVPRPPRHTTSPNSR